jgi:hypothetical protein
MISYPALVKDCSVVARFVCSRFTGTLGEGLRVAWGCSEQGTVKVVEHERTGFQTAARMRGKCKRI